MRQFLLLVCCATFLGACGPKKPEKYTEVRETMTTTIEVSVCASEYNQHKIKPVYDAVWKRLDDIAVRMNVYDASSDVAKVNAAAGGDPVAVPEDTYFLLQQAVKISELTDGAFDVTVWPLMQLWKRLKEEKRLPSIEEVRLMRDIVGYRNLEILDDGHVHLRDVRSAIDLGGIAAGYAVDEIAKILRENGFHNFFLDLGGDIYAGGTNCSGDMWRVGIRDPKDKAKLFDVVHLFDQAVTTSGNYEKFFEIDGHKYSHIMDPRTALPQEGVISATLIAPTAIEADALATAVAVLGVEKGIGLVDDFGEGYAVTVVTENAQGDIKTVNSRRFDEYHKH